MNPGRFRAVLFLVFCIVYFAATVVGSKDTTDAENTSDGGKENDEHTEVEQATDIDEDGLYQINPDYLSSDISDPDDHDDNSETEDQSDEEVSDTSDEEEDDSKHEHKTTTKQARAKMEKVLNSKKNPPKGIKGKLKEHRLKITIALALFAFRHELKSILVRKFLPIQWNATSILKIIVFVDIMRQLQSTKKRDPLMILFLLLGAHNPVLSSILTKALLQENNAYVPPSSQHYTFERYNQRFEKDCLALQKASGYSVPKSGTGLSSIVHNRDDARQTRYSETMIVLDLTKFDNAGARIDALRDEVSFIIYQHRHPTIPYHSMGSTNTTGKMQQRKKLEVLVLLESPGGSASDFALASQQMLRLRDEDGIEVTICVDKVAASGGYMIACTASPGRLFAAPFAVLGSIGVIGQTVNVHKMLEGWGVQPMVFKAGKDKAPLGLIGEISKRDMESVQLMVDETHVAFKRHVAFARPTLAKTIDELATGKIWLGYDALKVGLIDRIITSDVYIFERMDHGAQVLKLIKNTRRRSIFGGHNSRSGFENRIQSAIINPLKSQAKKTLMDIADRINIPYGQLDEVRALSSLASAKAGGGKLAASTNDAGIHTC